MNSIKEYAPYLIAGAFICGTWLGFLVASLLAISGAASREEERRGYPTKEES